MCHSGDERAHLGSRASPVSSRCGVSTGPSQFSYFYISHALHTAHRYSTTGSQLIMTSSSCIWPHHHERRARIAAHVTARQHAATTAARAGSRAGCSIRPACPCRRGTCCPAGSAPRLPRSSPAAATVPPRPRPAARAAAAARAPGSCKRDLLILGASWDEVLRPRQPCTLLARYSGVRRRGQPPWEARGGPMRQCRHTGCKPLSTGGCTSWLA